MGITEQTAWQALEQISDGPTRDLLRYVLLELGTADIPEGEEPETSVGPVGPPAEELTTTQRSLR